MAEYSGLASSALELEVFLLSDRTVIGLVVSILVTLYMLALGGVFWYRKFLLKQARPRSRFPRLKEKISGTTCNVPPRPSHRDQPARRPYRVSDWLREQHQQLNMEDEQPGEGDPFDEVDRRWSNYRNRSRGAKTRVLADIPETEELLSSRRSQVFDSMSTAETMNRPIEPTEVPRTSHSATKSVYHQHRFRQYQPDVLAGTVFPGRNVHNPPCGCETLTPQEAHTRMMLFLYQNTGLAGVVVKRSA